MTESLLNPEQREQLEALLANSPSDAVRRRARLLLLLGDGHPTSHAAETAGITPGRARHWRSLFRVKGMQIFPDAGQAGESAAPEGEAPRVERLTPEAPEAPLVPPAAEGEPPEPGTPDAISLLIPVPRRSPLEEFAASAAELKAPGVLPEDSLAEAGRKVLRFHFAQMLLHEEGTHLGEDIEELHDMRVATRRMRAGFEVFGDAYTQKSLKNHLKGLRRTGRTLGSVRDLDVFMEKVQHYEGTLPEGRREELIPLLASWAQEREAARAQMVAYLDSEKYASFKRSFYGFLSTPGAGALPAAFRGLVPRRVREVVPVLIYTRLASVRAYDPILENATLEQFHSLRIEFKKLRYTVEFFREVLGEESKAVINEIKAIQDHLGDLNDAQVAAALLRDFLTVWDTQQAALPVKQRQSPEPVLAYLSYRYAERQSLMVTFQDAWQRFNHPDLQHQLALAVSAL